jgi:glyoxylase-like metal-dependent hydrolase (beta-lactamase superfamily II)
MSDSPPGHPEIERIIAPNPGPMTLEGTNTYVVAAAGGAFVIDPGPADPAHAEAVRAAADRHGPLAGIVLTHSHLDHSAAVSMLDVPLVETDTARAGPFEVLSTPGHAADHVCLLLGPVCFSGDLVLGRGSSYVPPDGGSLASYLDSLQALLERGPGLICPGHGPYVTDPAAKIAEYIEHRLDRERRLLAALAEGERSRGRLLDRAWDDVPPELRAAAAAVMAAHLDKLDAEGALSGIELLD